MSEEGAHDYFERLSGRPGLLCAYSLRDHDQLMRWANGDPSNLVKFPPPQYWIDFYPLNDTYHARQDAVKVIVPPNSSGSKQVRFPCMSSHQSGQLDLRFKRDSSPVVRSVSV